MSGDQTENRGGRRPGAGRKPGSGAGRRPELREVAEPDLVAYCKARQAWTPGYLGSLVRADIERQQAGLEESDIHPEAKALMLRYLEKSK